MSQYCDDFKFSENNPDHFVFGPQSNDNYQYWQGLRGPYFSPSIGEDGYLYWTNNGQLPNPEPVRIVGKDGRGITLTGQCETVADLPEDPEQGEAWAVGEEEPFECYAWFGEWVDMGLLFPAGQDGVSPAVTITTTATGHKVKITDRDHPSGQEFDVDNGEDGDPGQDGVSPAITITQTSTGHKVKITDKDHPSGQEFNVNDGEDGDPGPGVPPGGSAGQFYRKASGTDYDGEWHTLSAGDSSYDSSLTYASGTVGEELSSQRNTLSQLDTEVDTVENSIAIIINGNTSTINVSKGQYVYLKNSTITGRTDGLYTYNSDTQKTAGNSFVSGELTGPISGGGLNDLKPIVVGFIGGDSALNISAGGRGDIKITYATPQNVVGGALINTSGLEPYVVPLYVAITSDHTQIVVRFQNVTSSAVTIPTTAGFKFILFKA